MTCNRKKQQREEVQLLCATLSDHSPFIRKESLRMSGKR